MSETVGNEGQPHKFSSEEALKRSYEHFAKLAEEGKLSASDRQQWEHIKQLKEQHEAKG